MIITLPRSIGRSLAAGMTNLNTGDRAVLLDLMDNAFECLRLRIVPKPKVRPTDAAFGCDRGSFDNDQSRATTRQGGIVNPMPIVYNAILSHILTHGRNDNTIAKGNVFKFVGIKETCH